VFRATLVRNEAAITNKQTRSGRFILASNVLNPEHFSNDQLLTEYKAQQSAERGFRFLRDPLFFTSSVFLNTPSRVAALVLIMALSLLVYTLGQRLLRQNLAAEKATIRHQTGKATSSPTLRWVFQLFQAVHLIVLKGVKHISNLTKERQRILSFFCPSCRKYYLLV
jgi:transposase